MKRTARILIADHDETSLLALESTLAGAGYQVKTTKTGQDALTTAGSFRPHVCIVDPMLPDIDGFSLSMEIKALGNPVRILVSTATQMDDHAKKEARSRFGVAYCLVKPYGNDRLLQVVRAVLTPKKKREAQKEKKQEPKLSKELDEMLEKTLSGIDLGKPKKRKKKVSDSQKIFTGSRPPVETPESSGQATMQIDPNDLKIEMEKIKLEMTDGPEPPASAEPEVRFRTTQGKKASGNDSGALTSSDIFGALIQDIEDGKVNESEFTLPGANKKSKVTDFREDPETDLFPDMDDSDEVTVPQTQAENGSSVEPSTGNQYQFLEKIATGGMAEVWKGKLVGEKGFEKIVAIKKILSHLSANEEFITMFTDEAKVAAKLTHPNIAQIYELKTGDPAFIAMEYVSGHTLRQILTRCKRLKITLTPQIVAFVGMKLCNALYYAHNKTDFDGADLHIVHRDVSPQNVIISLEGEIKLVDFGIAKASIKATETVAGSLKGKLLYMSPEQGDGKPLDHRSDIFSLANVLYEAMTGERLFAGNSELAILENVRKASFPKAREVNSGIPLELETILDKALACDPEQRYASAKTMEHDLKNYLKESKAHLNEGDIAAYLENLFDGDLEKLARFHEATFDVSLPVAVNEKSDEKHQAPPAAVEPVVDPEPPPPKRHPPARKPTRVATEPVAPPSKTSEGKSKSSFRYIIGLVALLIVAFGIWFQFFRTVEDVPTPPAGLESQQVDQDNPTDSGAPLENTPVPADTVSPEGETNDPEPEGESGADPSTAESGASTADPLAEQTGAETADPTAEPALDPITGEPIEQEKDPELERLEEESRKKREYLETLRKQQEEKKKKEKKDNPPD